MIKVENIEVHGFNHAVRGMRNPMNSWDMSDSEFIPWDNTDFKIGNNDLDLMKRLVKSGTEHRKFDRMIVVWMDITAPLYWWKEFDTYKVGTVANSCSTMHKIHDKEFTLDDFSHEHLNDDIIPAMNKTIWTLNQSRKKYLETKDKQHWWQMIQLLPSSYNQKRTVMMNYEVCARIIEQRQNHKLDEWHQFIEVLCDLPYLSEMMMD